MYIPEPSKQGDENDCVKSRGQKELKGWVEGRMMGNEKKEFLMKSRRVICLDLFLFSIFLHSISKFMCNYMCCY